MSKIDSDHFEHAKLIILSWPKWKQDINLTGNDMKERRRLRMAENECKRLNTDGMRKLAKSVKEGQGTRVGSIAKMLIDCCDRIDRLTTELKAKDEEIARLKELLSAVEHVYPGRFNIEQALKAEDKDNG